MLWVYHHADRTIWVQPLPLSKDEVAAVIDKLEYDVQEEHKYYAYDHFWDNCTTRVRDVLDNATGGSLRAMKDSGGDRTYRDLARDGFYGMRVPLLITDIAMGRVTDRVPTYWSACSCPTTCATPRRRGGASSRFPSTNASVHRRCATVRAAVSS